MSPDDEGLELPSLSVAIGKAIAGARELIAADIVAGKPLHQSHRVEVTDDAGQVLHVLRFGDMVQLLP